MRQLWTNEQLSSPWLSVNIRPACGQCDGGTTDTYGQMRQLSSPWLSVHTRLARGKCHNATTDDHWHMDN
eukprot:1142646-Pelagomonas_calceolata.AAC.12